MEYQEAAERLEAFLICTEAVPVGCEQCSSVLPGAYHSILTYHRFCLAFCNDIFRFHQCNLQREAAKEDNAGRANTKQQAGVGANLDLKV